MFTRRNNTQRGAPNDDNLVTARGQPQRNNGQNGSNSGESRRNGRGHAATPSKTPKSTGVSFIAAATKKDRNLRPLIKFVKKGIGKLSKLPLDSIG